MLVLASHEVKYCVWVSFIIAFHICESWIKILNPVFYPGPVKEQWDSSAFLNEYSLQGKKTQSPSWVSVELLVTPTHWVAHNWPWCRPWRRAFSWLHCPCPTAYVHLQAAHEVHYGCTVQLLGCRVEINVGSLLALLEAFLSDGERIVDKNSFKKKYFVYVYWSERLYFNCFHLSE